jgi:ABC-type nitrate/sulfonate/bicarbonate transport system substrate-binding protein
VEKSLPGGRIGEMRGFLKEHSGAFDPDEVHTLVAAFDKAWEAIQASGVVYPEAKAETVRAILAKHIIAAAKNGERDHGRLRDGALLALAQANLRTSDRPPR